jgi:hypothetical protein
MQCEKLVNSLNMDENSIKQVNINSRNKPKAPVITLDMGENNEESDADKENLEPKEIEIILCDTNKEIIKNSVKVISYYIVFKKLYVTIYYRTALTLTFLIL